MANVTTTFEELKNIIGALYVENLILETQVSRLEARIRELTAPPEDPKPTPRRTRK